MPTRYATPAPLTVLCSVDQVGMRYRHRLGDNVEIWQTVAGQCCATVCQTFTFATWWDIFRSVSVRRPNHLARYLHQLTFPSSRPVLPQDSSLLPRAMLALRAATVSSGVGVEGSPVAASFCAEAVAMLAGTAATRPADYSCGLCIRPPAISCSHGREGLTHWLNLDLEGM